jgi:hypothetical protein
LEFFMHRPCHLMIAHHVDLRCHRIDAFQQTSQRTHIAATRRPRLRSRPFHEVLVGGVQCPRYFVVFLACELLTVCIRPKIMSRS